MAVLAALVWLGTILTVVGDIVIQGPYDCGRYEKPLEVRITTTDEETIYSQSTQYYQNERNCIVTIIGKLQHQFHLTLTKIDLDLHAYRTDHCKGLCCNDFLKIYNSYRVDNARLLPGVPQRGLCGTELPRQTTFTSTQNFLTIQFKTDVLSDARTGFELRLRQYPWRNPGNVYPDGGYFGGWNDGQKNELRMDWTEQAQLPGDWNPGGDGTDQDKDPTGPSCYVCYGCKLEFFEPKYEFATEETGCYVCSKRYTGGFAQADRSCYTRTQYLNLLSTLRDPTVGSGEVSEYRGCRRFMNYQGEFYNYCFCDSNLCNAAPPCLRPTLLGLLPALLLILSALRHL